jgi:hypothetical protein
VRPLDVKIYGGALRSQSRNLLILAVLAVVVLVAVGWASYHFSRSYPGGERFIEIWIPGRAFLSEGLSPYSTQVQTQTAIVVEDWAVSLSPGVRVFRYPIYTLLLALPVVLVGDYTLARALWIFILVLALLLHVLATGRLTGWRPKILSLAAVLLFALFNPYTLTAIVMGDLAVLTLVLVILALMSIRSELDELAGILLALSTITPHLVLPLLVFITLWGISQRRDRLLLWTYGSWALLIAGTTLLSQDWLIQYIQTIYQYYQQDIIATPGQALQSWWPGLGAQMGWILTFVFGFLLLNEWRLAFGKGPRWFLWTASLTLAAGPLLGLRTDPANLVIVLLPLILVTGLWDERWGGRYGWSSALILTLLFLALWAMVPRGIEDLIYPGLYPVLYFPLPVFTILGLYWVRWLAVRPRGTVMDELRRRGEL